MTRIRTFLSERYALLVSLALALVSLGFFFGIDGKLFEIINSNIIGKPFSNLSNYLSPKYIAFFFVALYTVLSLLFSLVKSIPTQDKREISPFIRLQIKFFIWVQSLVFALSSFLYYTTVKKSILPIEINLSFLSSILPGQFLSRIFVLHTGYVFILLVILGFFVNQNLFGKNRIKFFLLWCQNLIFAVLGFGFVDTLDADRSSIRNFSSTILYIIANINPFFWIMSSIVAISVVSVIRLRQSSIYKNFCLTGLFIFLLSQFVIFLGIFENIISYPGFGYWHKSIFLAVFWSMIFYPIATIIRDDKSENFIQKTWLSFGYHLIVFVAGLVLILI